MFVSFECKWAKTFVVYNHSFYFLKFISIAHPFLLDNCYPRSFYLLYSVCLVIKVQIFLFFFLFVSPFQLRLLVVVTNFSYRYTKNDFSNITNMEICIQMFTITFTIIAFIFTFTLGVKSVVCSIGQCNAIVIQLQFIYCIYILYMIYMHGVWGVYLYSTLKYIIYKIVITCCRRRWTAAPVAKETLADHRCDPDISMSKKDSKQ